MKQSELAILGLVRGAEDFVHLDPREDPCEAPLGDRFVVSLLIGAEEVLKVPGELPLDSLLVIMLEGLGGQLEEELMLLVGELPRLDEQFTEAPCEVLVFLMSPSLVDPLRVDRVLIL